MKDRTDAVRAAWGAKFFWVLAHIGIYLVLLFYPSELHNRLLVEVDYWYFILYNLCLLLCSIFYLTVGSNPGYITQVDCEQPRFTSSQVENSEYSPPIASIDTLPLTQESRSDPTKLHFCEECKFTQPFRTKHCEECDRCVSRFDHHCFFIGSCVGQRNHLRFLLYIFVQAFFFGWTLLMMFSAFRATDSITSWLALNVPVLVSSILLLTGTMISIGLFIFHCYLALTNQTTWEVVKREKITYLKDLPEEALPFDRGLLKNVGYFVTMHQAGYTWEIPPLRVHTGFNICVNQYWSCF